MGYPNWETFAKVIDRTQLSCKTTGHSVADHFLDVRKMIPMPKGAEKQIDEMVYALYNLTPEEIAIVEGKK